MAAIKRLMRPICHMGYSTLASHKPSNQWGVAGMDQGSRSQALKGDPKGSNMQLTFLGCPGVGKGTHASRLSRFLGIPHIATGDLLRDELAQSGPSATELASIVSQGKLVPDEIIVNLLSRRLEKSGVKGESGFILDGFPRTRRQAEILEKVADIDVAVNLKLREDVLLQRCLGRRICSQCGNTFNVAPVNIEAKDGHPAICMPALLAPPRCESKLIRREDDREEVVKERLRVYHDNGRPVEDFYRSRGKLLEFELSGSIPESCTKLLAALNIEESDSKHEFAAGTSLLNPALNNYGFCRYNIQPK